MNNLYYNRKRGGSKVEDKVRILGTGMYAPEKVVTNEELSHMVDTNDEWISSRTGIKERRVTQGEDLKTLAYKSAMIALQDSYIDQCDLDLIIVATSSQTQNFPSIACEVQGMLGAKNAAAFDLLAACSGFIYALSCAKAYINSGMYKKVLIIGTEVLSNVLNWEDRNTCVLFGDGAAAMILGGSDREQIPRIILGADGTGADMLTCGCRDLDTPFIEERVDNYKNIKMDGRGVFKFAVSTIEKCIKELLEKENLRIEDIDYIVCHQANYRIIESVSKRLSVDINKFYINLDRYGNTSSASIGIAFDEMNKNSMITEGKRLILVGFGAGLTYGAALINLI